MNKLCVILFFVCELGFSQNLEERIYLVSETFIANSNETSLEILNHQESKFIDLAKTKDEQLALIFLQTHKAYFLFRQSKLKEALRLYENIYKRYTENELQHISDFDIIENCLKPLGTLYTKTGDFTNALNTINQYIYLAKKQNNTRHQISGSINLAKLYYTLGNHDMVFKTVNTYIHLSNIDSNQKEKLLRIQQDSEIALNEIPTNKNTNKQTSALNAYKIALKQKDYQTAYKAFKTYKSQIDINHLTKREHAQLYIEESQLFYLLKQTQNALTSLNKALKQLLPEHKSGLLPNKNLLYPETKFIDIFDLYAEIETNPNLILNSLNLSFYVFDLLKNNWSSQETRILNETNNRLRSEKCINILFETFNSTKDKKFLYKALQYAENNKASVLKDLFLKRIRLEQHPNDLLLLKEFRLLKEQEQLTSLLVRETNNASKINTISKKLNTISIKLKDLNQIISNKYSTDYKGFSLEKLNAKLQEDQIVLTEYFYGKNNIYQFIVSKNNIKLNKITQNNITKKAISNFINFFNSPSTINNNIQYFTEQAFNIYKILKFDALSSYKNILIIPDGLLNFIPFEAFLYQSTNTTYFSKMPFVLTKQTIAYNSNIELYLNTIKMNKSNHVLGLFPVFENTKQALTYSLNEAEAIDNKMDATILTKNKATKHRFMREAKNFGILHLSTHASSGDFETPANISFYDDRLFLNELYGLNLNSNLVVLSACETGIGKLYKGEGTMSIARGFQYAGAQNLLFSLWQINDLSTSEIMTVFYRQYNKHGSAFMANYESKIDYLNDESISNPKKSPYYWSAFVYYGEISKPSTNNTLPYIILSVIVIMFAIILKLKKA